MRIGPAVLLEVAALFVGVVSIARADDFYVDPSGSDTNSGASPQAAFRTIQRAAQVGGPGDVIHIQPGIYRETVRPKRSGEAGKPIVFEGAPGGPVIVSGADVIVGWRAGRDGVHEAPMPADFFASAFNQSDQVFLNGKMLSQARWPNQPLVGGGINPSRPAKSTITQFISKVQDPATGLWTVAFEDDRLEPAMDGFYEGAEIYIQPNSQGWGWTLSGRVVRQEGKRLTVRTPNGSGEDGHADRYAPGARYYLFNKRELLDAPGEWFHDRGKGLLCLKFPGGTPDGQRVEAKARDLGFDLSERSWITVKGLSLFACSLSTDRGAGGDGVPFEKDGRPRYPWRGTDYIAPSHHVVIDKVDAEYLNHFTDVSGHFYLQWTMNTGIVLSGEDHVIQNCRLRYGAGNGISLQGRRHRALNNVVLDMDYQSVDCAPVSTGTNTRTWDVEVAGNTIARTARSGITLRGLQNSDPGRPVTRIHHNIVANYMMQDWDAGAFYMAGQDGKFVRIDHNRFYLDEPKGGMCYGAYWDFSKNYVLDHNVLWGQSTPIQITREFDEEKSQICNLIIVHNTVVTNGLMWCFPLSARVNNGSLIENNIFRAASFKDPKGTLILRWPVTGSGAVTVRRNLLYGAPENPGWTEGKPAEDDVVVREAGFLDEARKEFRLRPNSPAAGAAVALGEIVRDGVHISLSGEPEDWKDLGAFPASGKGWNAGSTRTVEGDLSP